jgi:ElaB/YqjD/DUF883 family membrane-anchored ribosome-binding protein
MGQSLAEERKDMENKENAKSEESRGYVPLIVIVAVATFIGIVLGLLFKYVSI